MPIDQFDRPDLKAPDILYQAQLLERALVTPMFFSATDRIEDNQTDMILRYVKIPEVERKARQRDPKRRGKIVPIYFSAAFCMGFH